MSKQGSQEADSLVIQVLHTSDLHGKFRNYAYAIDSATTDGGLAAIATVVKKLRNEYPHTLLIDTGDTLQDNSNEIFIPIPNRNPMVLAMNALNYDSWTVGNHEFNFGVPYLQQVARQLNCQVLGGNVYDSNYQNLFPSFSIIEKGGVKVAIVGLTTPTITKWDSENLANYKVETPVEVMERLWPYIKDKADLFIFANHQGVEDEFIKGDGYRTLLELYPQFHLALGGHIHAVLNIKVNETALIEPSAYGIYLGRALIHLKKESNSFKVDKIETDLISMKGVYDDEEILKITEKSHQMALTDAHTEIGVLIGGNLAPTNSVKGLPQSLFESTAYTALINEVQMYYTGAKVSATPLFRFDGNLEEGPITKANAQLIYKYENTLRSYKMKGFQLKRYLEWSARFFNQFKEGDLIISFNPDVRIYWFDIFGGIQYNIDISKEVGSRITKLCWSSGKEVEDGESFIIAVNDYRGKATLNQEIFIDDPLTLHEDLYDKMGDGSRIRDLIAKYIDTVKHGKLTNTFNSDIHGYHLTGYHWDEEQHERMKALINEGLIDLPTAHEGRTINARSLTIKDLLAVDH